MPKYVIQMHRNFWPDAGRPQFLYTGGGVSYRVPDDIPHEHAEAALKQGAATRVEIRGKPVVEKMVAPETKDEPKKSGPTGAEKPSSSAAPARASAKKTSKRSAGASRS